MAPAHESKRTHLERARQHLASDDPARIRYAALELRLALEVMTREKLNSYAKYLPASFASNTWQPPKQLKVMRQVAENADKSFELHVGSEAVPGVSPPPEAFMLVGKHKSFSVEWLSKNYSKLGSFVHARAKPMSDTEEASTTKYMGLVADEIATAQESSILGMCMVSNRSSSNARCAPSLFRSANNLRASSRSSRATTRTARPNTKRISVRRVRGSNCSHSGCNASSARRRLRCRIAIRACAASSSAATVDAGTLSSGSSTLHRNPRRRRLPHHLALDLVLVLLGRVDRSDHRVLRDRRDRWAPRMTSEI
jgi:hypothetical protein